MSVIKLIGDAPNQVSRNKQLGDLAFQDAANIAGSVGVGGVLTVQAGTAALPSITPTGDTNTGLFFPAADTIAFSEGGVEAMRLDSAGNLGLGVTPSPFGTSQRAIEVYGATVMGANGYNAYYSSNAYFNSGWKYINASSRPAAMYASADGTHSWHIAPSGTAGNAISFTQAMTLDASGNVGIGTATPNASAILDVQSTTKGVRMPNMTTTQKNAIASPAAGLMVFDTTLSKLCVYSGAAWQTITSV